MHIWLVLTLCPVEDGPGGAWVGELHHGLRAQGDQELVALNLKDITEFPKLNIVLFQT